MAGFVLLSDTWVKHPSKSTLGNWQHILHMFWTSFCHAQQTTNITWWWTHTLSGLTSTHNTGCDQGTFRNDPTLCVEPSLACHWPVRTMINDRNKRPPWLNVNPNPHSAGGSENPDMATLWQWTILRLSRTCLASTSHLSFLSELLFQSIRPPDIWMVFNILVGTVCNGRKEAEICVRKCVSAWRWFLSVMWCVCVWKQASERAVDWCGCL